ncbi:MAG: HDIG domain-containing metalloprotein [candidate division WOR-3 bacterium]|nr:HDIG domain-containing protein [candidate division WOR-3 bacterium]MDH7518177.1 HDIG domain-containing protein [bacterium]
MDRETAWQMVTSSVKNQNLIKHMLATEACLRALARRLNQDEEKWGLAGLLHDLDYEQTKGDPTSHSLIAAQTLANHGVDPEIVQAVKAHSGNVPPVSLLDKAIVATDPVTGLIVAAALMHPTKKLANVDTDFVLRRFKDKRFAAGANREQIQTCSALGLSLEEFLTVCLQAMQCIAGQLGL